MESPRNWSVLLLAILLILWGATGLLNVGSPALSAVMFVLAIIDGALFLLGR